MIEQNQINEDKINVVVIDLDAVNSGAINEGGFLRQFGWAVEKILGHMFGSGGAIPVKVRGNPSQVDAFAKALAGEKRYMDAWKRFGLDDPRTYSTKASLERSINQFQRLTGLDWPVR